jgi:PKD repeat protein
MKIKILMGIGLALMLVLSLLPGLVMPGPASAATTGLTIIRYASDNTTVLSQTTVTYQWMRDNMPVLGDGTTHYYHQGPVFIDNADEATEQALRWNPAEDTNVDTKDMGAVKGTNLKDLCDLVGGMSSGEKVKVLSSDGWSKLLAYKNVYEYSSREGPVGICWYKDGKYPDTGYTEGMRMVWFADNSTNPWGIHAFGNWDWHEAAAPEYWYYDQPGGENYPTTTGISGYYVNRIYIYSSEAAPSAPGAAFTSDVQSGATPLTVNFTDQSTNTPTSWAWDFDNNGTVDSTSQNPSHSYTVAGTYTVKLTATNAGGSDSEIKTNYITVTSSAPDWDLNGDHTCNIGDVVVIGLKWGQTGTPGWIPEDVNNDGTVNIGDVVVIGLHWGGSW